MRDLNQLLIRQEPTPGTAITDFTSADLAVRLTDDSRVDPNIEQVSTGEIQGSSSSRPDGQGARSFAGLLSWILRPSLTPASAPPAAAALYEMGLLKGKQVKEITIGSVTGGPFLDGEIIRVGGNDRGKVFRPTSASPLKYTVEGGAIASGDTITGQTSGATASVTADPVNKGWLYRLVDSDFIGASDTKHHASILYNCGGLALVGRGCLGELSFELAHGRYCVCKSQILGAWASHEDRALYDVSSYPDEGAEAPRYVNTQFTIGSYSPTDLDSVTLRIPLGLDLRGDANHASEEGILFADYDRRNNAPTIEIEPALTKKATAAGNFDFFGNAKAGTTYAVKFQVGTSVFFYADEAQIIQPGFGARRNLKTVPHRLKLCGKKNDELQIYFAG